MSAIQHEVADNVKIQVPECIAIPKNVSTFNFVKKKHILFDKASEMSVN